MYIKLTTLIQIHTRDDGASFTNNYLLLRQLRSSVPSQPTSRDWYQTDIKFYFLRPHQIIMIDLGEKAHMILRAILTHVLKMLACNEFTGTGLV